MSRQNSMEFFDIRDKFEQIFSKKLSDEERKELLNTYPQLYLEFNEDGTKKTLAQIIECATKKIIEIMAQRTGQEDLEEAQTAQGEAITTYARIIRDNISLENISEYILWYSNKEKISPVFDKASKQILYRKLLETEKELTEIEFEDLPKKIGGMTEIKKLVQALQELKAMKAGPQQISISYNKDRALIGNKKLWKKRKRTNEELCDSILNILSQIDMPDAEFDGIEISKEHKKIGRDEYEH